MKCNLSSMGFSGCENGLVLRLRISTRVFMFVLGSMLPISRKSQELRDKPRVQCKKSRVEQGPREPKRGLRRDEAFCFSVVSHGKCVAVRLGLAGRITTETGKWG